MRQILFQNEGINLTLVKMENKFERCTLLFAPLLRNETYKVEYTRQPKESACPDATTTIHVLVRCSLYK